MKTYRLLSRKISSARENKVAGFDKIRQHLYSRDFHGGVKFHRDEVQSADSLRKRKWGAPGPSGVFIVSYTEGPNGKNLAAFILFTIKFKIPFVWG